MDIGAIGRNFYVQTLGRIQRRYPQTLAAHIEDYSVVLPQTKLQRALEAVEKFDFVGLTESYDVLLVWLAHRLGRSLDDMRYIPVRVQQRDRRDVLGQQLPELIAEIQKAVADDLGCSALA